MTDGGLCYQGSYCHKDEDDNGGHSKEALSVDVHVVDDRVSLAAGDEGDRPVPYG